MGKIWFYMMSIGIVGSIITNNLGDLNKVILNEASRGVEFAISLAGVMALWMGIMNIAKDSGLIDKIGNKIKEMQMQNILILAPLFIKSIGKNTEISIVLGAKENIINWIVNSKNTNVPS